MLQKMLRLFTLPDSIKELFYRPYEPERYKSLGKAQTWDVSSVAEDILIDARSHKVSRVTQEHIIQCLYQRDFLNGEDYIVLLCD